MTSNWYKQYLGETVDQCLLLLSQNIDNKQAMLYQVILHRDEFDRKIQTLCTGIKPLKSLFDQA